MPGFTLWPRGQWVWSGRVLLPLQCVSGQDGCVQAACWEWSVACPGWHHAWQLFGGMLQAQPERARTFSRSQPRLWHLVLKQDSGTLELAPRASASFSLSADVDGVTSDALLLCESSRYQARNARNKFCRSFVMTDFCHLYLGSFILFNLWRRRQKGNTVGMAVNYFRTVWKGTGCSLCNSV